VHGKGTRLRLAVMDVDVRGANLEPVVGESLSAVLAAENRDLRVYWVDPGDLRTDMHQAAFPGEDISDRPLPSERVPGLITLLESDLPSGRYIAATLGPVAVEAA